MPSSQFEQIPAIMSVIHQLKPQTILDVGCGYGKYGLLCRELLEVWYGMTPRIDAVEGFKSYITPLQDAIYDRIYVDEAIHALSGMRSKYDLVLAIDIIEHFSKDDGFKFINELRYAGKKVLISTPKKVQPQGAVYGNELEVHRSQWSYEELGGEVIPQNDNYIVLIEE